MTLGMRLSVRMFLVKSILISVHVNSKLAEFLFHFSQLNSRSEIIALVESRLQTTAIFTGSDVESFKLVCDTLLSCATQRRLASDLLQNNVVNTLVRKNRSSFEFFCRCVFLFTC